MSNLPNTAPHPIWCVRSLCSESEHLGRAVEIRSLDGFATITAQLRQNRHPAAVPAIIVSDGTVRLSMTAQQGRALAFILTGFARMAGAL